MNQPDFPRHSQQGLPEAAPHQDLPLELIRHYTDLLRIMAERIVDAVPDAAAAALPSEPRVEAPSEGDAPSWEAALDLLHSREWTLGMRCGCSTVTCWRVGVTLDGLRIPAIVSTDSERSLAALRGCSEVRSRWSGGAAGVLLAALQIHFTFCALGCPFSHKRSNPMPTHRISMRKLSEVLRLAHQQQYSTREIAAAVRLSHTTIRNYLTGQPKPPLRGRCRRI